MFIIKIFSLIFFNFFFYTFSLCCLLFLFLTLFMSNFPLILSHDCEIFLGSPCSTCSANHLLQYACNLFSLYTNLKWEVGFQLFNGYLFFELISHSSFFPHVCFFLHDGTSHFFALICH